MYSLYIMAHGRTCMLFTKAPNGRQQPGTTGEACWVVLFLLVGIGRWPFFQKTSGVSPFPSHHSSTECSTSCDNFSFLTLRILQVTRTKCHRRLNPPCWVEISKTCRQAYIPIPISFLMFSLSKCQIHRSSMFFSLLQGLAIAEVQVLLDVCLGFSFKNRGNFELSIGLKEFQGRECMF